MWISKKKWKALEKKVADLEKSQLQANDKVKKYIEDSEALSNQLSAMIKELPKKLEDFLLNHSSNE